MGDFSQSPLEILEQSLAKGYVGAHIEQGVPILDRDLNLMHDLVSAVARAITTRYIGNGIAADQDGFGIAELPGADNDFQILADSSKPDQPDQPGTCLVNGIEVTIDQSVTYRTQSGGEPALPSLTTPDNTQPETRIDTVYLDVWLAERNSNDDELLRNSHDVGMQTSVRLCPMWIVRVAEGTGPPDPRPGHAYYPLARLERKRGNAKIIQPMIHDLRQRKLTLMDLEQRVQEIERLRILPAFREIDPLDRRSGAPGTEVTMRGRNFDVGVPRVRFGAVYVTKLSVASSTEMKAFVPDGLPPGEVPITIEIGKRQAISPIPFRVQGLKPEITSISPATGKPATPSGPATVVTITGNHFQESGGGKTTVNFGNARAEIDSITNSEISTRVPIAPSGSQPITVATQWGTSDPPVAFTVVQGAQS